MNSLNIQTANFKYDDNYMFLHDPAVFVDLHDGVGQRSFGYMEKEKIWRQAVEYATFSAGIPSTEIRRDIITQTFTLEATVKQIQPEILALLMQRRLDDSNEEFTRLMIGTEVPEPLFPSVVLVGKNVNKRELRLYIRKMQITAEDLELTLGGDTHAGAPFKGTALKDPDPLTTNPTWMFNPTYADQDNIAFFAWAKATGSSS